jgi:AcrR family transcriptional regulator
MDTWLETLSPTALNLLEAARRILVAEGYAGVTLEAVALEAGEDKATIKRHFGSKAGLIHALFDQLGDDIFEEVNERTDALPSGPQRTHVMIRRLGDLSRDRDTAQGMYELAPHALRDPILRQRLAALYAYYRSTMFQHADMAPHLEETSAYEDRQDILALPALVMAVIDGMSLQVNLDPAAVDCDRVFALLDLLVSEVLEGRVHTGGRLEPPEA